MQAKFVVLLLLTVCLLSAETWTAAFKAGRFGDALAICDDQLKSDPNNGALWTGRALALERLGGNAESIKSFERALQLKPSFIPALEGAAELSYRVRDSHAQQFLDQLLKADPKNETAHAMAGVLAFERHDCTSAVIHFEQAPAALDANQEADSFFGTCLLQLDRSPKAVPVFTKLLERHPASANLRYNLGDAQLLSGHAADAIDTLRPLTAGDHPDADALNLLAAAEASADRLAPALADLRKAAQMAPEVEANYLDFAALCLQHDSTDLALQVIDVGLQHLPRSARLHSMRGIANAQNGKYEKAATDFEQADRLSPDKAYGSVGLSVLYAQSKHPDEAAAELRSKLKMTPSDPTLNYLLADILIEQQETPSSANMAEAKAALLRSIAAKPDFANAHALLGKVLRRTGESTKAVQELKLALTSDPRNRAALNQIVIALRETGNSKDAAPYVAALRELLRSEANSEVERTRLRIVQTP